MSRAPKRIRSRSRRLAVDPAGHVGVFPGRQDVDDLVVLHVGHRGHEVGPVVALELDERGLVEPDGRRFVESFAIGLKQCLAVGGHGIVDGVPVTGELRGHL
jgi:hypothetical protein